MGLVSSNQQAASQLDLREFLQTLRRRKLIVVASLVVVLGASLGLSYAQKPRYAAAAKLLLVRSRANQSLFNNNGQFVAGPSVQTEIEVIKTEPVQQLVRKKIGAAPPVQVSAIGQTELIVVRAESERPQRAADIANAYAQSYIDFRRTQATDELTANSQQLEQKIAEFQKQIEDLGSQLDAAPICVDTRTTATACAQRTNIEQFVTVRRASLISQQANFRERLDQLQVDSEIASGGGQLVTPASPPAEPFSPKPMRAGILGVFMGLVLGFGLAFLVEYLDDSIKGKEELERAVPGIGTIGLIPQVADWRAKEKSRLVSLSDPTSPGAEAYRILRTSIQFLGIERQTKVIQMTSASAQEGKTTTLSNLAVAFANSGLRTVVVCCDLRRPRLHQFFGLDNAVGFTSVLLGNVALSKALQPVPGQERLLVLASGPLPPNPAELLSSSRTADLLRNLGAQADVVLIDCPPVLPVTDSIVLSQRVDATVLVVSARTTSRKAAHRAAEMLQQVNAPLIGAVLNGITEENGYGGYTSRYYTASTVSTNGSAHNGNGSAEKGSGRLRRKDKRT